MLAVDYRFEPRATVTESITTIEPAPVSQSITESITTIEPAPVSWSVVEILTVVNQTIRASVSVTEQLTVVTLLWLRFEYVGDLCADRVDGYARVVDERTGEVVGNVHIPSADAHFVSVEAGVTYRVELPSSGRCATGSCVARFERARVGGTEVAGPTIRLTITGDTNVTAVYRVSPEIELQPRLVVAPSSSVRAGACPDGRSGCFWFDNSIAVSLACTLLGDVVIDVYELRHAETIRLLFNDATVLTLPPYGGQGYAVRTVRVRSPCEVYLVALTPSCRVVNMKARGEQLRQAVGAVRPTITVPKVELASPELASPSGIVMLGSLVGLFVFVARRTRWTHALFVTAVVLAVGSMVVFQSPQLFVLGLVLALVAIVVDRHL